MFVGLLCGGGAAAVGGWWVMATVLGGLVAGGIWAEIVVGFGCEGVSSDGGRYVGGCTAVWGL